MQRPTTKEERALYRLGYTKIAGVDEAGRGSWAGPLVAAAVVLPKKFSLPGLNDSKKLTPKKREELFKKITRQAVAWQVSITSVAAIDRHGVGRANVDALRQCVAALAITPEYVLVDGFRIGYGEIPSKRIVHGDARVATIAAASIVAKVTRDRLMVGYHRTFPRYQFHRHKGYGTALHRRALERHGVSPLHRRSFAPIRLLVNR